MEDTPFLRTGWLTLKDEKVFISLKCSLLFDFLSEVFTHECVVHENRKADESLKFSAKRVIGPFNVFNSLPQLRIREKESFWKHCGPFRKFW